MKAHEQTWEIVETESGRALALPPDSGGFEPIVRGPWTSDDQLQLASAAPELARALLDLEFEGQFGFCPSCGASRYDAQGRAKPAPHFSNCTWNAALRKAGVR